MYTKNGILCICLRWSEGKIYSGVIQGGGGEGQSAALIVKKCKDLLMERPCLAVLASQNIRDDLEQLDKEWQRSPDTDIPPSLKNVKNTWRILFINLLKLTNGDDVPIFNGVLALPASNDDAESLFSKAGLIKTKQDNTIHTGSTTLSIIIRHENALRSSRLLKL